jgi:hypothetical protein
MTGHTGANNPNYIESMKFFILAASALFLTACKKDCRENVRLGDFEYSQNNYARAEKLYKEAWATDSVACADVAERLTNLRRFLPSP